MVEWNNQFIQFHNLFYNLQITAAKNTGLSNFISISKIANNFCKTLCFMHDGICEKSAISATAKHSLKSI